MKIKKTIVLTALIAILNACAHKEEPVKPDPVVETIPGGKGGIYHVALFPVSGTKGVSGHCYIKYGCKAIPPQPVTYDDSSATMVEPGYGPHAHFNDLKAGFYLLSAKGTYNNINMSGDTIVEIIDKQPVMSDCYLQLK